MCLKTGPELDNELVRADNNNNNNNNNIVVAVHVKKASMDNNHSEIEECKNINSLPQLLLKQVLTLAFHGRVPSHEFVRINMVCKLWSELSLSIVRHVYIEELWGEQRGSDIQKWCDRIAGWLGKFGGRPRTCLVDRMSLRIGLKCEHIKSILAGIASVCHLVHLEIPTNRLDNNGAIAIAELLARGEHLKSLDLSFNKIEDSGVTAIGKALETNSSLTKLNLSNNLFSTQANKAIFGALARNNSTLTDLNVEGSLLYEAVEDVALALESPTCELLHLNVSSTGLAQGAKVIFTALSKNSKLLSLKAGSNQIAAECGRPIAMAIATCSLTSLDLPDNLISDHGLLDLAQCFLKKVSLRRLSLVKNRITFAGISHLFFAFASTTERSLTEMDLSDNPLTPHATPYISFLFSACPNRSLRTVRLRYCQIGDAGIQLIAKALTSNDTLTSLDLSGNYIQPCGSRYIAQLLRDNNKIQSLYLANNSLGNEGASIIAEALKVNRSLHTLDLENNDINIFGAMHIIEALQVNQVLNDINLWIVNVPRNLRLFLKKST
eukprot:gene10256-11958_t